MSRYTKSVATVVRAPYTVVTEIWHNLQRVEVGAKVMLSAAEAKYHLLAGRLKPYEEPVVAEVAPVAAPKKAAKVEKKADETAVSTDA